MTNFRIGILALLLLLARCGQPVMNCDLHAVARLPLEVQDRLLVVPAGINGTWVHLVVDTGAERTTIAESVAEELGLPHDIRYTTRSTGVGGVTVSSDVKVDRFVLGNAHIPIERIAVSNFKLHTERGLHADGLLGADILLAFDMDIDVPGGTLTLYRRRVCPDAGPPWKDKAIEIRGVQVRRDRLVLPVTLDGAPGMAILDTGAQGSVIGLSMASRLGLDDKTMAHDPLIRQRGVGPAERMVHIHRFGVLRVGPTQMQSPVLTVMSVEAGLGDMLIGEDFLRNRRVWLSFSPPQVFVTAR